MYQFIESICCLDGVPKQLHQHQVRMARTYANFFPEHPPLELSNILQNIPSTGKYKCRLEYGESLFSLAYHSYKTPIIKSLRVVYNNHIDYKFKSTDRSQLDALYEQRKEADNIIIIRDGLVTDSYYANLAFFDGSEWWTPISPLLSGTKRADLLEKKIMNTKEIYEKDLRSFTKVCLINAMLDLGEVVVIRDNIIT